MQTHAPYKYIATKSIYKRAINHFYLKNWWYTPRCTLPLARLACACTLAFGAHGTWAQPAPPPELPLLLQTQATGELNPAWRFVGFPAQHTPLPPSRFEAGVVNGTPALRVTTQASYGTWVYRWATPKTTPATPLTWRWRVDRPLTGGTAPAQLHTKAGDDAALKLCVMFDHPLERVPFVERTLLRVARGVSGEPLPAATVCYVWDPLLPPGTTGTNPYTRRVRFVSLGGPAAQLGQWSIESRNVAADFRLLFADELGPDPATAVPALTAVVLGADSDNTASASTAWVAHVGWATPGH